ncbi:MAG TPA: SpoIIE family protein phosphatase, partial [Candidatus Competibacteraceae bacterium]|nr:SpoIIE family protein phosphatase [Candidatus Competibacteraceae bacterium]
WDWMIASVGDVSRVETEAQRQKDQLRTELANTLPYITTGGNAAVFIFDGQGRMVVPPENRFYLAAVTDSVRTALMRLVQHIEGEVPISFTAAGGEQLEGHATYVKALDWYIAALASRDAIREPARKLMADQAGIFLAALAIGLILAYFFAYRIALPLNRLSAYAMKLSESDFSANDRVNSAVSRLPTERRDEIGRLSQAFLFMEDRLHANVRTLMQAVAARERIEGELNIARDIQMDLLPKVFPAFPDQDHVDIYALLAPAREVGGDLYNFYFLDKDHLCFAIGDVSGKGVPAALFMTIAITLIRMASERESNPARIMSDVNAALSRDNPNCMFVTLVVGVLDVRTGRVAYVNAGHNPPLVLRQLDAIDVLSARSGPAAGVTDGLGFALLETQLAPGECLLLYTDGVTEAMDTDGRLYSDQRLHELMGRCRALTAEERVHQIMQDVRRHVGEAEQSDDITILAVRYCG